MKKIVFLKGLPASGKSTYAKELVKKGYKRVNKDDLRDMIDSYQWSKPNEKFIVHVRNHIVRSAMEHGYNIVVDDSNFEGKHLKSINDLVILHNTFCVGWEKDGRKYERYEIEEKFIDTPLEECIERDRKRTGRHHVGEKVITEMYNRYLKKETPKTAFNPLLPTAIICDIDGTLAEKCDRNIYDYTKVEGDHVIEPIATIVRDFFKLHQASSKIIIVSGREDSCLIETETWLYKNNIPSDMVLMRKTGDHRQDAIVKKEIYDEYIKDKYNILFVLDDRKQVVDMWRSLGLTCLQVAEGDF